MESLPDAAATTRRNSREELIERLYEELQVPHIERERHYDAVARLLDERRPSSWLSATSTAYSRDSKRSTQASFASSHTSYSSASSNLPQDSHYLPIVAEEANENFSSQSLSSRRDTGNSFSRSIRKRFSPNASSISSRDHSTTPGATDDSGSGNNKDSRRRWCPWCQQFIGRPNDFKKHVMNYCCGTKFFVCRNQACRSRVSQEGRANIHRRDSEDLICRQHGWSKEELQCKRQHFGCGFCAVYFDNLETFIDHFGGTCRPDRVRGHWQRSRQIKALLQQPALLPIVEALCIEFRGYETAYRALWWTWRTHRMESIIRKLEYGPKVKVDDQHPGIPCDRVGGFLRDLIRPSPGSQWAADLVTQPVTPESVAAPDRTSNALPPYIHESMGQPPSSNSNHVQDYVPDANTCMNNNIQPDPLPSMNGMTDAYLPSHHFFQPQPVPNPANQQLAIGAPLTVLAVQQQGNLQYDWDGMVIDDSNEMLVDTQWIGQELGQTWNPHLH